MARAQPSTVSTGLKVEPLGALLLHHIDLPAGDRRVERILASTFCDGDRPRQPLVLLCLPLLVFPNTQILQLRAK